MLRSRLPPPHIRTHDGAGPATRLRSARSARASRGPCSALTRVAGTRATCGRIREHAELTRPVHNGLHFSGPCLAELHNEVPLNSRRQDGSYCSLREQQLAGKCIRFAFDLDIVVDIVLVEREMAELMRKIETVTVRVIDPIAWSEWSGERACWLRMQNALIRLTSASSAKLAKTITIPFVSAVRVRCGKGSGDRQAC